MSIDEVYKRLPKAVERKPKKATIKRRLPSKDDELLKSIAGVIAGYRKKTKKMR